MFTTQARETGKQAHAHPPKAKGSVTIQPPALSAACLPIIDPIWCKGVYNMATLRREGGIQSAQQQPHRRRALCSLCGKSERMRVIHVAALAVHCLSMAAHAPCA